MSLVVQKFGGSSVADLEKIRHVSSRVKQYHDAGHRLVVVFSVMGKTTDWLLEMARELHPSAPEREVDVPPLVSRSPLPWLRLHSMPGVAALVFKELADLAISLDMISTSNLRISCLIPKDTMEDSVRALHPEFIEDEEVSVHEKV